MNSLVKLVRHSLKISTQNVIVIDKVKYSNFRSSPFVCDLQPSVKFEITKEPAEWAFVERALPPPTIPKPQEKSEYHSTWKPQSPAALQQPYFIKRTRNHMLPVYLNSTYRGMRRLTQIRLIEGDIWQLETDLKQFLQQQSTKPIRIQVHEFAGNILIHGDHVNAVKHWLQQKQF